MSLESPVKSYPDMTLPYDVILRRGNKRRVILSLRRDNLDLSIGHYSEPQGLAFLSPKPRPFWDEEDEEKIQAACKELINEPPRTQTEVGSIELQCFLTPAGIEVRFLGKTKLGEWTPERGLRFFEDAHPAFCKDRSSIALRCAELPQGSGGIFSHAPEESQ